MATITHRQRHDSATETVEWTLILTLATVSSIGLLTAAVTGADVRLGATVLETWGLVAAAAGIPAFAFGAFARDSHLFDRV